MDAPDEPTLDDIDEPVTDLAALERRWRFIAGPWGFDAPQLFAIVLDAGGRQLPTVVNVTDDDPSHSVPATADGLYEVLATVVDQVAPGGSAAVMRARPGRAGLTATDRAWVRALHASRGAAAVRTWPVFHATDDGVVLVPPDELVGAVSSRGAGSG